MRLREYLTIAALLTATIVPAQATQPAASADIFRDAEERRPEVAADAAANSGRESAAEMNVSKASSAVPSPLVFRDKVFGSAYFNTLSILSASNACSDFFGGPSAAVDVFKQLIGKARRAYLANRIGMTMSGETVNIFDARTHKEYRLFSKVSINANGPFYRKRVSMSGPPMPRLGTFEANTKEVRVLMFLHELGHVMKGEDGHWLLPNDGKDEALSHQNSRKIEEVCGDEIKDLDHESKREAQPNEIRETKALNKEK